MPHKLPCINNLVPRRHILLSASAAVAVAACGSATSALDDADTDALPPGDAPDDSAAADDAADALDDAATADALDDAATDAGPACTPGRTQLGMVTDFAEGTWTLDTRHIVIIGRDAMGLFVFSAACTHQFCTVRAPSSTGVSYCPCHGSRFDGNGAVLVGPATRPLPHYAVTVCDGVVYVDKSMPVPASTRTPV